MTMPLPHALTTREAMNLLKIRSYGAFNALLERHGVAPAWRGGKGNVYRGADMARILTPVDTNHGAFNVF